MIRNAKPGDAAVSPSGDKVTVKQVHRAGGRVRVTTTAGDEYAAWDLRPVGRHKGKVKG